MINGELLKEKRKGEKKREREGRKNNRLTPLLLQEKTYY